MAFAEELQRSMKYCGVHWRLAAFTGEWRRSLETCGVYWRLAVEPAYVRLATLHCYVACSEMCHCAGCHSTLIGAQTDDPYWVTARIRLAIQRASVPGRLSYFPKLQHTVLSFNYIDTHN